MKQKLVQWLYHLLAVSQSPLLEKMLIIANVILHDWRIFPPYGGNSSLMEIQEEEISEVYHDMDEESIRYLFRFYAASHLPKITGVNQTFFFYNAEKFLTKEDRKRRRKVKRELTELSRKYHVPLPPESGWHHHGLREIPNAYQYTFGKIFIDAGACYGDSAIIFLDKYAPLKVCSFEPSERNCQQFKENLKGTSFRSDQYELIQKGVSDKHETLSFQDTGNGGNNLMVSGDSKVEVVSLDEFCRDLPAAVGFIKADVEGFGLKMLRGAEQTIRRDRPILCLSIYHNREEFLGIYRCLKDWNIDYHVWIRLHRLPFQVNELNLIACPSELRRIL